MDSDTSATCVCRGYLGPGGIQDNGQFRGCIGGATGYLDRQILGESHIFKRPTAREIYGSGPFDPEGIVGKTPVVAADW
jgi:heparan-alpha-glucosaminide N-acetyltransferase